MNDQGAGGGIESRVPTHNQKQAEQDALPTENGAETDTSSPEPAEHEQYPQASQQFPRQCADNREDGDDRIQGLARNPSSCSTATEPDTNVRQANQYFQGPTRDSRPSPPPLARPEPPITKATLSELDVNKIIHNPKLRHDINFDPELHFRPNVDGEKGRKKEEKADQFWKTLREQLTLFATDRETFYRRFPNPEELCLPMLLKAVKEIIQTLVPQRDRELLEEGLNVDLLMQQFDRGVADLEKLASWISTILKMHCAPMRDEWIDKMYGHLSKGNREDDVKQLVDGMCQLLSVLEAMKLDVANHQIRCLRPMLIEDTVNFEQRFFQRKIHLKKLDMGSARAWYEAARERAARLYPDMGAMPHAQAFGDATVFFEALAHLVLPSTRLETIPNTFLFDEERIVKLRSDLFDSVCLEVCVRKFQDLDRTCRSLPAAAGDSLLTSTSETNFNASSRPSSLTISDRGSIHSSPRTSFCLAWQPNASDDVADSRQRLSRLYDSLLALLGTAPPTSHLAQRWQGLAQPMALQVTRFVTIPAYATSWLVDFEDSLVASLDTHSDMFIEVEASFYHCLLGEVAQRVQEFRDLSGLRLFTAATGPRMNAATAPATGVVPGPSPSSSRARESSRDGSGHDRLDNSALVSRDLREEAGFDDIASRLAHLGTLHWRIWAHLAYVDAPEPADDALCQAP